MKKSLFLFSVSLLFSIVLYAQNKEQAFDWALNPGANSNSLKALHYDSQGNLLVLASASDSASFGDKIITAPAISGYPTNNYYIGKRNTNGTSQIVLQSRSSTTNGYSDFSDFNIDDNDNIIVVGATPAGHDFGNGVTLSNKGYIIAKYNSSGTAQWAKMYNFGNPSMGSFTSSPWKVSTLPNGTVIAILAELSRFAIIKIDANGNELLNKSYTVTSNVSSYAKMQSSKNNCIIDNKGNIFFYCNVGNVGTPAVPFMALNNDTTKLINGTHPAAGFVWSFDSNGNKRFSKAWRGSILDVAVEKNTGNILLNWAQYGAQNNIAPMDMIAGNNGIFQDTYNGIIVIDSLGNYIKKSIDTPISAQLKFESILPLGNSKLIATKKWDSTVPLTAGTQTYSLPSGGAFTWFELDQNLVPIYFVAAPLYSQNLSLANNAISRFNNKVAVGASWYATTQQTLNVNGTILKANNKNTSFPTRYNPPFNAVGQDIMIAQFSRDGSTSVSNILKESIHFTVYPNPANDVLNIKTETQNYAQTSVSIKNILGEEVLKTVETSNNFTINTSQLTSGVYFISITNNGKITTQKIIID